MGFKDELESWIPRFQQPQQPVYPQRSSYGQRFPIPPNPPGGQSQLQPTYLDENVQVTLQASPPILNQDFSFTSGISPWTTGNNATLTQSSVWSYPGTIAAPLSYQYSALLTGDGVTASPEMVSEFIPVTGNTLYTYSAELYSPQGYNAGFGFVIFYWDANKSFISADSGGFASIPAAVTAGTLISTSKTTPSNARFVTVMPQAGGTPASTVQFFVSLVQVNKGSAPSNGLGYGQAQITPQGPRNGGLTWQVNSVNVQASSNINEALVTLYVSYGILPNAPQARDIQGTALLGSTGATASMATPPLRPSDWIICTWAGGDPGAVATMILAGSVNPPGS